MRKPGALRRRRVTVVLGYGLLISLIAATVLDRGGRFGYGGDDWNRFNRRAVEAHRIIDGDTFVAQLVDAPHERVTVRLVGVDAPDPPSSPWSAEAREYLAARLKERQVLLRLDGTQTRNGDSHLLALVYVTDGDCLNVDVVRDGQGYADRRVKSTMRSPIETAERDARAKKRGLWHDIRDEDQPAWRQEWLKTFRRERGG